MFVHSANKLCPQCTKERNEEFAKVKDCLRRNLNARIHEVVAETGVSLERVREFITEGRLKIVPIDAQMKCEICGNNIRVGRICSKCEQELASPDRDGKTAKMHLMQSIQKERRRR